MDIHITAFGYWTTIVLLYITAAVFTFKKNKPDATITWKSFGAFITILLLLPLAAIVVPMVLLYRMLINKILAFKHKKEYGGLLNGDDVVHVLENVDESKIKVLFVIDYDKDSNKDFYSHVKEKIHGSKAMKCPKTRAVFKKSYGYYYFLKNQVNLEDCIKELTVRDNDKEMDALMQYLEDSEDMPLPNNNSGLWDVFIGTHPINWKPGSQKTYYPILFRFHHSLFDGYHMVTTIIQNFADEEVTNVSPPKSNIRPISFLQKSYGILRQLFEVCTFPWRVFLISNANNSNILCKPKLQNKKIFSHRVEENRNYIQVIKEIKKRSSEVSFTDIILAAISSSLSKYICKNSAVTPNHISVATPEVPYATNLLNSTMQDAAAVNCINNVYFSLRNLPMDRHMDMVQRLNFLKNQGGYLKSPYQITTDYYLAKFLFSTFPDVFIKKVLKLTRTTAIVTNLPGPSKIKCLSGHSLEGMLMWSISKGTTNTGIGILFFTYNGRLHISLSADKAVISTKHDLDDILLNIYVSLDELHQLCTSDERS